MGSLRIWREVVVGRVLRCHKDESHEKSICDLKNVSQWAGGVHRRRRD